jgi:hypothetical protein
MEHYLTLKKLENFMKSNIDKSKIELPTQEQLTQSIMYCNKWGIEYYKTNKMIDGFYQILSIPNELNANQVEQLYLQIETMRNTVIANNNAINEIYRIMIKKS